MQESGEMYLETILTLSEEKSYVRSIDVADAMNFSKPSVSRAMSKLKADNHITIDKNGFITLTDSGRKIATKIFERHTVLSNVLMSLGVDEETATADACRMEHVISDKTFDIIKKHIEQNKKK
ncbi:MAG: metal-dependent transcriptional regulator [Lachnospiraceae bacterium]|nr:metal-dependent transcriptional regulator [Lachnospiraceae bacterium]